MKELSSKSGSVEKALKILECFDVKNPLLTLEEISEKVGYSKPTIFRMICSLEKFGYIKRTTKESQMKFQLGMVFLEKSLLVTSQLDIREIAKKEMLRLRNDTGLSVQLAIRDGHEAVYIEQFESLKMVRVFPQVGRRVPLYAAACPRVLMAFLPEEEQKVILETSEYIAFTPYTKTNHQQILDDLNEIHLKGYAISKGELHAGTLAIAVPVKDINSKVIAALSIISMEQDFRREEEIELYIDKLRQAASQIEKELV